VTEKDKKELVDFAMTLLVIGGFILVFTLVCIILYTFGPIGMVFIGLIMVSAGGGILFWMNKKGLLE
jgi:hypothetical protein